MDGRYDLATLTLTFTSEPDVSPLPPTSSGTLDDDECLILGSTGLQHINCQQDVADSAVLCERQSNFYYNHKEIIMV